MYIYVSIIELFLYWYRQILEGFWVNTIQIRMIEKPSRNSWSRTGILALGPRGLAGHNAKKDACWFQLHRPPARRLRMGNGAAWPLASDSGTTVKHKAFLQGRKQSRLEVEWQQLDPVRAPTNTLLRLCNQASGEALAALTFFQSVPWCWAGPVTLTLPGWGTVCWNSLQ